MACATSVQFRDRNASCTLQPVRCWIKPAGFIIEIGARLDPRALGWQEDINCVTYRASSDNCNSSDCDQSVPCVTPTTTVLTTLTRRSDNTATLRIGYGEAGEVMIYRLTRQSDNQEIFIAQTSGGIKNLIVTAQFPPSGSYRLTVVRAGQVNCQASELDLTVGGGTEPGNGGLPTTGWVRDGGDILAV